MTEGEGRSERGECKKRGEGSGQRGEERERRKERILFI